ncbi:MAG: alpha/beta hydrolase [Candidatus Heimdallarchaeota archaeon]|nr:alpha/beta hydrolase [Candidatus Heimdallarchaeota archaeon]
MDDMFLKNLPLSSKETVDFFTFPWLELDYVTVEEGILLRVFKIDCKQPDSKINIVVVAGLCSNFLGWIDIDNELSNVGHIYHIETREKSSAIHYNKKKIDYSMERYAIDISKVVEHYNLNKEGFYLFGDSFGSEVAVKYLDGGYHPPKGLILISPEASFSFSGWMKVLFRLLPYWSFHFVKPLLKFILKYLRTDMKNDPGSYYINKRNIVTSNPKRMKKCAMNLFYYKSDADYSIIKCPTFIIAASTDKMHTFEKSIDVAKRIPNTTFEDVIHYQEAHSRESAAKISKFILEVEKEIQE